MRPDPDDPEALADEHARARIAFSPPHSSGATAPQIANRLGPQSSIDYRRAPPALENTAEIWQHLAGRLRISPRQKATI
jgi:hypothetical protein